MNSVRTHWLVCLICLAAGARSSESIVKSQDEEYTEDDWFALLSHTHKSICQKHLSCDADMMSTCCGWCTCDEDCFETGSCCLGVYDNFTHGNITLKNTKYRCIHAQYFAPEETDYNTVDFYWMVSFCENNESTIKYRKLCETPAVDGSPDTLERITPVTDRRSGVHYKNINCAYCNGVDVQTDLIKWHLQIEANHYFSLQEENLFYKLKEHKGNIIFVKPRYLYAQECQIPVFKIASCNETGLWSYYDKHIEKACNAFIDPFNMTYKNYYCYLCNREEIEPTENLTCKTTMMGSIVDIDVMPPFFAMFDTSIVKSDRSDIRVQCDPSQVVDNILNTCHDVKCHEDRQLDNGKCAGSQALNTFRCLAIFFKAIPKEIIAVTSLSNYEQELIQEAIGNVFHNKTWGVNGISENMWMFNHFGSRRNLKYILLFAVVFVPTRPQYHYLKYIDSLFALHGISMHFEIKPRKADFYFTFTFEAAVFNFTFNEQTTKVFVKDKDDNTVTEFRSNPSQLSSNKCIQANISVINKLKMCPFLEINVQNLSHRIDNDVLYINGYGGQNLTKDNATIILSKFAYEIDGNIVRICLEDYLKIYDSLSGPKKQSLGALNSKVRIVHPKDILSLACICLSIVCLLVTIAAYCTLSALQSNPGIDNLILCIFLLLAQTVYQFGVGQTTISPITCAIIGAICHFLWLCVVFSMNMCSIQMFIIFNKQRKVSPGVELLQMIRKVSIITCSSLVFVGINLMVSFASSSGKDSGYGGEVCYISSKIMQTTTFVIPSAIIITINIFLFCYVVNRIRKINIVSVRLNKERNYLGVYARLSTLTGLTWLAAYLRILLAIEVLEYLFIILNASQGVFIMISFVLNRRVFAIICHRKLPSSSGTQIVAARASQDSSKAFKSNISGQK